METTMNLEMPVTPQTASSLTLKMGDLMSDDNFFQFCQMNDTLEFERDSLGNIIVMSPTGANTANLNAKVSSFLVLWSLQSERGEAFDSSAGFILPNGAVRSPDASWISTERWCKIPEAEQEKFPRICPDLVIEIRSKTDSLRDSLNKMVEYQKNGARLGWLIDPIKKKVYIYNQHKEVTIIDSLQVTLYGEDVLPGFELDLTKVFKDNA